MKRITYLQLCKENETHFEIAKSLWLPFLKEIHAHEGVFQTESQMEEGLRKRIAIQGTRKDMHFEVAFWDKTAVGIAMFAIDLGTVRGLLDRGHGTVMGFYIRPEYRRQGIGTDFWRHIELVLAEDGAIGYYLCPDAVSGVPFWVRLGFENSGLIDPDDHRPIYIRRKENTSVRKKDKHALSLD